MRLVDIGEKAVRWIGINDKYWGIVLTSQYAVHVHCMQGFIRQLSLTAATARAKARTHCCCVFTVTFV